MDWLLLILAGLFEVAWALGLKESHGFTRLIPSLFTLVSLLLSVVLLGLATKTLPLGTAYAVWVGIGVLGTSLVGMILYSEPATLLRLLSLIAILAGVVGLKLSN